MRGNLSEQDLTDYALNELNDVDRLYVESMLAASEECRNDIVATIQMAQCLEQGFERELILAERQDLALRSEQRLDLVRPHFTLRYALRDVASALGIRVPVLNASTEHDLDECFASLRKIGADALIVPAEPFFDSQRDRIVALAARYAVPMIAGLREYVAAGGLMSYGPSLSDSYRRAGIYVGRVLNGEKPADLPVMQPTKFDLVLSLKTAKALGLTVPDRLLALADEVIE